MLTLTNDARLAIHALLGPEDAPAEAGIRIATAGGRSDGAAPELALDVVTTPAPGDEVVESDGARVYLDATAARMLEDQTLDVQFNQAEKEVSFFLA